MAVLPVPLLSVFAVGTTLAFSALVWHAVGRRDQAGARAFAGIAALLTLVPVLVLGAEQAGMVQWHLIPEVLFYPYVALWAWFAIDYTGERGRVSRTQVAAISVPLVVGIVDASRRILAGPPVDPNAPTPVVELVANLYAFALLFGGVVVLARAGFAYASSVEGRTVALGFGALLPVVVPLVVVPAVFGGEEQPSAFLLGYATSALALAVAVYGYDLFASVPVAEAIGRDTVVTEMDDGVVVLDEDGRIVDVNPAAERLLGIDGKSVLNESAERLFEGDGTVPAAGNSTEIAVDDGTRILSLSATSLVGADDDRVGRILTLRDVTERVNRRRQLETLNRQNERLDQLVSVVSHDLRNPLSTASGYLDMAADTGDPQHVETAREALDRMDTIVEEMLTMARAGIAVEETETVALTRVVGDAWETARSEGASLENDLPEGVTVEADRNLLRHVFENLFRNASEHNDPPVTVRVGTLTGDAEGFYVEDDGEGIPEDEREEVFEHGFSTNRDGTGFGLSIVEQFVTAHGWEIAVTESEDGGARFEVRTDGDPEADGGDPGTREGVPASAEPS